jgi:hypothetical protein
MDEKDVGGQIQKKEWTFKDAYSQVPNLFKEGLLRFYSSLEKELKVYSVLTLSCYVVDLLANLVFLIFAGKSDWPATYCAQLFVLQIFHFTTLGLLFYAVLAKFKIPQEWQIPTAKAMLGIGMDLKLMLSGQEPLPKPKKQESANS